jgi:hypothetical protein
MSTQRLFFDLVKEYGKQRELSNAALDIITMEGARISVHQILASPQGFDGATVRTVDDEVIFVPSHRVARIEVHTRPENQHIGFQMPREESAL